MRPKAAGAMTFLKATDSRLRSSTDSSWSDAILATLVICDGGGGGREEGRREGR